MAISFVNAVEANATTVSTATHAPGDLLTIVGWRTLSTLPGDPGVPWATDFTTTGGGIGVRVAHTIGTVATGDDSSGTWTGAGVLQNQNYNGAVGIGAVAFNQAATTTPVYPALTLQQPGTSWVLRVCWHNGTTNVGSATLTGYVQRLVAAASTGQVVAWDSNGPVNSCTLDTASADDSATQWRTLSIEILAQGPSPQTSVIIPNRSVGPMALRRNFRRATPWPSQAAAVVGDFNGDAATDITVGLTADGVVGTSSTADTTVTVGLTAAGAVGAITTSTTTAITVGLTAAGAVGVVGADTTTALTVGLTADGTVGGAAVETGAQQPLSIPNRYVGPMALRARFRRSQPWIAGPDNFNANATDTAITVGLTAAGTVGALGDAVTAVTVGLTAAGAAGVTTGSTTTAVTVGLTAAASVGVVGQASTAVTVGLSAAGVVGVVGDATTAITVGLTAETTPQDFGLPASPMQIPNRYVGPMALRFLFRRATFQASGITDVPGDSTTTAVTVGLTAAGAVGVVAQTTTTSVTVGLTAAGAVGKVSQASTTVTVGLTAAGVVGVTAQTTTTAVTIGLTAAGAVGVTGQTTTTAVTVGLSAAGIAVAAGTAAAIPTAITVGLTADGVVEIIVPANRSSAVKVESRTVAVRVESRTTTVKPESRVTAVKPEARTVAVKPESRTVRANR